MLFCRLVPARPLLPGPHIYTCAHSPMHSAAFSTLPCWGWLHPLSNTCRTKTRWVSGCHPARGIPACTGTERFPWPHFQPQRLGGPQRKEIGLQTSLVSVHLHVKQFSHTVEGVFCNIPSSLGSYEMAINTVLSSLDLQCGQHGAE